MSESAPRRHDWQLTGPELDDTIRDLLALVTANMPLVTDADPWTADHNLPFTLALDTVRLREGETAKHWIARLAQTLDMASFIAASWLAMWAEAKSAPPESLLRTWAREFTVLADSRDTDEA